MFVVASVNFKTSPKQAVTCWNRPLSQLLKLLPRDLRQSRRTGKKNPSAIDPATEEAMQSALDVQSTFRIHRVQPLPDTYSAVRWSSVTLSRCVDVAIRIIASAEGNRLEADARSAGSFMTAIDRRPSAGTVHILARYCRTSTWLSFDSCNYDIFSGWCPYSPWATHIHVCLTCYTSCLTMKLLQLRNALASGSRWPEQHQLNC
jgi:hypothetical protein